MFETTPTPDTPPATPRHPWDQMPEESAAAFGRFLAYRNIGPSRSLERAYSLHSGQPPKSIEPHQVSGQWRKDCAAFHWVARAEQWDLFVIVESGQQAVARYLATLSSLCLQVLRKVGDDSLAPKTWADVLETVRVLGQHVPPDTILAVATRDAPPLPPTQDPSP